ncbi:hypothetical protein JCM8547_004393 [Rhodosporidiobolus lusitaniae]
MPLLRATLLPNYHLLNLNHLGQWQQQQLNLKPSVDPFFLFLRSPFTFQGPDDPLVRGVDYDIDQIVLFEDWYHSASDVIIGTLNTPEGFNRSAVAPLPKSGHVKQVVGTGSAGVLLFLLFVLGGLFDCLPL